MNKLYDFYGNLLTDNQRNCFELYYAFDFSLNEIAEELSISKQGVSENIRRAVKNLNFYEEKLQLLHRFEQRDKAIKKLNGLIKKIDTDIENEELKKILDLMRQIIISLG